MACRIRSSALHHDCCNRPRHLRRAAARLPRVGGGGLDVPARHVRRPAAHTGLKVVGRDRAASPQRRGGWMTEVTNCQGGLRPAAHAEVEWNTTAGRARIRAPLPHSAQCPPPRRVAREEHPSLLFTTRRHSDKGSPTRCSRRGRIGGGGIAGASQPSSQPAVSCHPHQEADPCRVCGPPRAAHGVISGAARRGRRRARAPRPRARAARAARAPQGGHSTVTHTSLWRAPQGHFDRYARRRGGAPPFVMRHAIATAGAARAQHGAPRDVHGALLLSLGPLLVERALDPRDGRLPRGARAAAAAAGRSR